MPVDPAEFRQALRQFATGVTVVTTRDVDGRPCGLTVSAFAAVSLEPPLVLVCVARSTSSHDAIAAHGWFAVHVLGAEQEALARRFAAPAGDRFAGLPGRVGLAQLPLLADVVAALECRIVHAHPGGDHTIFVGEVERTATTDRPLLLHARGRYRTLAGPEPPG